MIVKSITASLLFCGLYFGGLSQAKSYQTSYVSVTVQLPEQETIREKLAQDSLYPKLPAFERDLIYFLNYVRQYPRLFAEKAVKPYLAAYPEFRPVYGESLLTLLQQGTLAGFIFPNNKIVGLARRHAIDVSTHDLMSHISSDGTGMQDRFARAGLFCGSECINMLSKGSAVEVLLSLLVDYQVESLGHRKSLLADKMKSVGVGMRGSQKGLQYTVIDLGCD